MSTPKLFYFDIMGRAEMIRLVFAAAGKQLEDVRFPETEWPQYKEKAPFGLAPYMEIDGKLYAQSVALSTYFAKLFDLYGKTDKECLQIDQLLNVIQDFITISFKIYEEPDEEKKAEKLKTCKESDTARYMGYFEKLLKENGTGYYVGDRLTLADLAVFDVVTGWMKYFMGPIDGFPLVNAFVDKIGAGERIKAYMA
ncbi:glutathione S-transferase 1, partial [Aplysia californica]|uniref:Glutathione S-transferase 1 n=1 Tax=Aplysia californica TaxID=6500 RepID=A0ABM1A0R1_APLCA